MNGISEKNKLKLAEFMYILVVGIMIYLVITDNPRQNVVKKDEANAAKAVISNIESDALYKTYINTKYGFKIDYPSNFEKQPEEAQGSQTSFFSQDKKAKLIAYGSNNVPYETSEMLYRKDLSVIDGDIKYKAVYKDWYVISWIKDNVMFYRRVNVGTEALNSIIFSYPVSNASIYNAMLEHIILSFKPGNLESAH